MMSQYTFSVGLFEANAGSGGLQVWQSGTLTLDTSSPASLNGVLTLQGFYPEPIPFVGTSAPVQEQAGITVTASGKTDEAQIDLTLTYNFDGFLYSGSYIGGLVSILDTQAEETYLYVLQGLSPQGPFGAKDRSASAVDKRVSRAR